MFRANVPGRRPALFGFVVALSCLLASNRCSALGEDPDYVLHVGSSSGYAGTQRQVSIFFDHAGESEIIGWSYGICHPSGLVRPIDAGPGTTTQTIFAGGLPAFEHYNIWQSAEPPFTVGVNQAVVIDYTGSSTLGVGTDYELMTIEYQLLAVGSALLEPCDTTQGGSGSVAVALGTVGGVSTIFPTRSPGTIEVTVAPEYLLKLSGGSADPAVLYGPRVLFDVAESAESVAAWSYGICHDPAEFDALDAVSGTTTATILGGAPAEYEVISVTPNGADVPIGQNPGISHDVLISFGGESPLPSGTDYELLVTSYAVSGSDGDTSALEFCATVATDLGPEPTPLAVETSGGSVVAPGTDSLLVTIASVEPVFQRGNCNNDQLLSIADPITMLTYVFGPMSVEISCADACDVNDDGQIDIADPVNLLSVLFVGGSVPPPPFPSCNPDPTEDDLDCLEYSCDPGAIDIDTMH